jgi:hypothetical protein
MPDTIIGAGVSGSNLTVGGGSTLIVEFGGTAPGTTVSYSATCAGRRACRSCRG